jgi:hypothetical protein
VARIIVTNGDHAATALSAYFPDAEILIWRDVLYPATRTMNNWLISARGISNKPSD